MNKAERTARNLAAMARFKSQGCVARKCPTAEWWVLEHVHLIEVDHIDPTQKYRTRDGKSVHPSDMVYRYSHDTLMKELAKCQPLCPNCHAVKSDAERRLGIH